VTAARAAVARDVVREDDGRRRGTTKNTKGHKKKTPNLVVDGGARPARDGRCTSRGYFGPSFSRRFAFFVVNSLLSLFMMLVFAANASEDE
jgi:hypothetical protein